MDIDRFKSINDQRGHPVGDVVNREIAQRCGAMLDRGSMFARWGGEEFAAIYPFDADHPAQMAEAMRIAIASMPIDPAGQVTASFGTTCIHSDDCLDSALKRADEALYRAKQSGRNRVDIG